jgi:pimeloyl-ACP methyl ester carboxylesterase
LTVTVVLVHGNPETDAVWDPLADALGRNDVVRLSPPGFGAPLPSGFPATVLAYRDWLVDELAGIDQPVDLVGHDWGGCHVVNAMMHRPDLVRSWASDTVGLFDPDYVWHDMAQAFQTPGVGEQLVEMTQDGSVEERAQQLVTFGIPPDVATSFAAAQGPEMSQAILAVYRSARQPALADAGRALDNAAARPDCRYWPPRTPSSAPTRSGVGRPTGRAPELRCSTGWDIGGWCRTRPAAPQRSAGSGNRLVDNRSAAESH